MTLACDDEQIRTHNIVISIFNKKYSGFIWTEMQNKHMQYFFIFIWVFMYWE